MHEAKRRAGESERVDWLTNHDERALSCSRDSYTARTRLEHPHALAQRAGPTPSSSRRLLTFISTCDSPNSPTQRLLDSCSG